ncbi:BON domain-containing protein [Massilia sp. PWRC2]|uniref:BON domain-containing protein n=1 Tax=Massilia sp. PWRC2 TaxID=2804626 RepID=UPI003CFB4ACA
MTTTLKTTLLAAVLAGAMGASSAAAPTAALNHDPATYRNVTQKAAADYKMATSACKDMGGNAKTVCMEEAKAARAHTEADAVAQYNNSVAGRARARNAVADADFAVARARCQDASGAEKDSCMANASAVHTAAVADVKADRAVAGANPVTTGVDGDQAARAAALEKCAQAGGARTGCLIDNRSGAVTTGTATTATTTNSPMSPSRMANQSITAVDQVADNTRAAAATMAEKNREVASRVADKTRSAVATVAGKTEVAAEKAEATSDVAARKTGVVVADSVITTKVKADLFKEPALKSMAIHVETEKGVVMLSGFVDSKDAADEAVALAKSIDGVSSVKSAIKVK